MIVCYNNNKGHLCYIILTNEFHLVAIAQWDVLALVSLFGRVDQAPPLNRSIESDTDLIISESIASFLIENGFEIFTSIFSSTYNHSNLNYLRIIMEGLWDPTPKRV